MSIRPEVKVLKQKKLVGNCLKMSLANNKTFELWKSFMPRRKEITNNVNDDLISMQVYDDPLKTGDFNYEFDKWAVTEVLNFENVPENMGTFVLKQGLYAVFNYKGLSTDNTIFIYIFESWLPGSDYVLDNRPHFELLGDNYKNDDPNSEEEIWIPIKKKD